MPRCANTNVDADTTAMAAADARIAQQPSPGAHECRVAFVHPKSTGGVLLELSTPKHSPKKAT